MGYCNPSIPAIIEAPMVKKNNKAKTVMTRQKIKEALAQFFLHKTVFSENAQYSKMTMGKRGIKEEKNKIR